MKLEEICKKRFIPKVNKAINSTPKLVPSYSSVCTIHYKPIKPMKLKDLYENTIENAPHTSLISAYDISNEKLDKEKIWSSDIVFIDSGKYESMIFSENQEGENNWSMKNYMDTIKKLKPSCDICLINYDINKNLDKQISVANECFKNYNNYVHDFLIKPEDSNHNNWNFDKMEELSNKINSFDIIGITEKELGDRLSQRCKNLLRFRELLDDKKPIHIFGCLDLISVILYFFCGADIFDGTSWMRYFYRNGYAIYLKQYDLITESWSNKCYLNEIQAIKDNLIEKMRFEDRLEQFINSYDFKKLQLDEVIINKIKKLLLQLGVKV